MLVKTSPDEIQSYLVDASNFKGWCDAVYFPENRNEVSSLLKEAAKNKTPVTIAGNGTGLTGARVPQGGIVISMEKMNKIIEINREEMFVEVEPAVLLSDLDEKLREQDLLYPPDPTEWNCFIGGTIATNASGEKTFKYGATRNFVLELEIVLADGEVLNLKRGREKVKDSLLKLKSLSSKVYNISIPDINNFNIKNASGYFCKKDMDAVDLFIGSEGTLGVITKARLKLVPLPQNILSLVAFFKSEEDGLSFIKEAREISYKKRRGETQLNLDALALEYMDKNSLGLLRENFPVIPVDSGSAVWFEQEVSVSSDDKILNEWIELFIKKNGNEENVWFATDLAERKKMEKFRHSVPEKVNEIISNRNLKKLGTDSAVPDERFEEYYFFCRDEMKKAGLEYVIFGHAGNSHFHLNVLPVNEREYQLAREAYQLITKKAIELKGTISAEHGIGKLKTDYLIEMYGEEIIRKMAEIKKVLDPQLILGIGTMIDRKFF